MPGDRLHVLFVCTGNSCRSVIAQKLLEDACQKARLPWEVRSCGVAAEPGFIVPPEVYASLKELGMAAFKHTPSPLTADLMAWADHVFAITRDQKEEIADRFPSSAAKTHLLRPFSGLGGDEDVADPLGYRLDTYQRCCAELREIVGRLVAILAPGVARPGSGA